jgi:hypothetical protein
MKYELQKTVPEPGTGFRASPSFLAIIAQLKNLFLLSNKLSSNSNGLTQ